jgi:hypothetical protein
MDETILTKDIEKRKSRALKIVAATNVSPNGAAHQFYVLSQSGSGRYLAATSEAFPPHGRCSCPDFKAHGHRFPCKHVLAAEIYEAAEVYAQALADRRGLTLGQLAARITYDLAHGVPKEHADWLTVLLHAAWRLEAQPCN